TRRKSPGRRGGSGNTPAAQGGGESARTPGMTYRARRERRGRGCSFAWLLGFQQAFQFANFIGAQIGLRAEMLDEIAGGAAKDALEKRGALQLHALFAGHAGSIDERFLPPVDRKHALLHQ